MLTWVWKLYVSFATAPLLLLRYICNRAAPRGRIVTTAQVTRQTRYSNTTCLLTPLAYCTRTRRISLGWH